MADPQEVQSELPGAVRQATAVTGDRTGIDRKIRAIVQIPLPISGTSSTRLSQSGVTIAGKQQRHP
jgi:hypothetical protein